MLNADCVLRATHTARTFVTTLRVSIVKTIVMSCVSSNASVRGAAEYVHLFIFATVTYQAIIVGVIILNNWCGANAKSDKKASRLAVVCNQRW